MRAVPDFHPEFGLLCPSPRRRRGMRLAALCIVTAMAIGATMRLAIARWPDSGDGLPATAEPMNGSPLAQVSAARVEAAPAHGSCRPDKVDTFKDLLALFLAPDCASGKHARHGARAANRVANVIIGRTDAVPAPTPAAETVAEPVEVKAADVEKSTNTTTAAGERTKSLKKPRAKVGAPIALTPPARDPSGQNAMLNPYAVPRSYDPYRNPYRATAVQSGFDPSFGRSW